MESVDDRVDCVSCWWKELILDCPCDPEWEKERSGGVSELCLFLMSRL